MVPTVVREVSLCLTCRRWTRPTALANPSSTTRPVIAAADASGADPVAAMGAIRSRRRRPPTQRDRAPTANRVVEMRFGRATARPWRGSPGASWAPWRWPFSSASPFVGVIGKRWRRAAAPVAAARTIAAVAVHASTTTMVPGATCGSVDTSRCRAMSIHNAIVALTMLLVFSCFLHLLWLHRLVPQPLKNRERKRDKRNKEEQHAMIFKKKEHVFLQQSFLLFSFQVAVPLSGLFFRRCLPRLFWVLLCHDTQRALIVCVAFSCGPCAAAFFERKHDMPLFPRGPIRTKHKILSASPVVFSFCEERGTPERPKGTRCWGFF